MGLENNDSTVKNAKFGSQPPIQSNSQPLVFPAQGIQHALLASEGTHIYMLIHTHTHTHIFMHINKNKFSLKMLPCVIFKIQNF